MFCRSRIQHVCNMSKFLMPWLSSLCVLAKSVPWCRLDGAPRTSTCSWNVGIENAAPVTTDTMQGRPSVAGGYESLEIGDPLSFEHCGHRTILKGARMHFDRPHSHNSVCSSKTSSHSVQASQFSITFLSHSDKSMLTFRFAKGYRTSLRQSAPAKNPKPPSLWLVQCSWGMT